MSEEIKQSAIPGGTGKAVSPLGERKKILLTDDDPVFLSLAEVALQKIARELLIAGDGAEAMEVLQHETCDVAIVDLSMPRVDGFRLIAHIRNTPAIRHLPVIVVSTRDDQNALDEVHRLGVSLFLTKPLNWTAFPYQVSAALRGAAPPQEVARPRVEPAQQVAVSAGARHPAAVGAAGLASRSSLRPNFDLRGGLESSPMRSSRLLGSIRR
jgi:PleD family two-component response regulator